MIDPGADGQAPEAIRATRHPGGEWNFGVDRNMRHLQWLVCTTDPSIRRDNNFRVVRFDTAIDYGGLRLCDLGSEHDLSTKRLLVRALLRGQEGRPLGACAVSAIVQKFDWIVRWRRGIGVARTSELKPADLRNFQEALALEDLLCLVPVYGRLDRLLDEFAEGLREIPLDGGRGDRFDAGGLASLLGVSAQSIGTSREFRIHLKAAMAEFGLRARIRNNISTDMITARDGTYREGRSAGRSSINAFRYLQVWELLQTTRDLPDGLCFDPFAGTTALAEAANLGRKAGRTRTLHPDRFLEVMDEASRWVLDLGPFIVEAFESLLRWSDKDSFTESNRAPMPIWGGPKDGTVTRDVPIFLLAWRKKVFEKAIGLSSVEIVALVEPMKLLVTACTILLAGFGARRAGEVRSLRMGCIAERQAGVPELSVYIGKNLQSVDSIPVPETVRTVVMLLERLSARTREQSGRDWLLGIAWVRSVAGSKRYLTLGSFNNETMWEFMTKTGLAAADEASLSPLLPHQLRRAFAVAYYHSYRFGSLDALSRFLRHFDPEVTRVYVNEVLPGSESRLREEIRSRIAAAGPTITADDRVAIDERRRALGILAERREDFEAARQAAFELRLLEMFEGVERPVGRGAPRLRRSLATMVSAAEARIRLNGARNDPRLLRDPLVSQIRTFVKSNVLEPVPGLVANCLCQTGDAGDLALAECLKERASLPTPWRKEKTDCDPPTRPDFRNSNAFVCLRCPHAVLFSQNRSIVSDVVEAAEIRARVALDPKGTIAAHAAAQRRAYDQALSA